MSKVLLGLAFAMVVFVMGISLGQSYPYKKDLVAPKNPVLVTVTLDKDQNALVSLNRKVPYRLITDNPKRVEFLVYP